MLRLENHTPVTGNSQKRHSCNRVARTASSANHPSSANFAVLRSYKEANRHDHSEPHDDPDPVPDRIAVSRYINTIIASVSNGEIEFTAQQGRREKTIDMKSTMSAG
jgi:hypothetical protein